MLYDADKVDELVLCLLFLNLQDTGCAWKNLNWDSVDRLEEKSLILERKRKTNRSVILSQEGLELAEELFNKYLVLVPIPRGIDVSLATGFRRSSPNYLIYL